LDGPNANQVLGQEPGEPLHLPEWYMVLRAAKYLGVAPWELERKSILWYYQAIDAMNAEAFVENERVRRQEQKARRGKKTRH
jgi:hypothetical protein